MEEEGSISDDLLNQHNDKLEKQQYGGEISDHQLNEFYDQQQLDALNIGVPYGENCTTDFLNFLTQLNEDEYGDPCEVICIFHNLKGYDSMFLQHQLVKEERKIEDIIAIGTKWLSFKVGQITFKDSFSFLPMSLSAFTSTFGLTELKKGFFPHLFHTTDHQDYVGALPAASYYDPESMSNSKKKQFQVWYEEQVKKQDPFDLKQKLIAYCLSDVALLKASCLKFVNEFQSTSGFDPIEKCATITSACNRYWRKKHLSKDTVAVEPVRGWRGAQVDQSEVALEWLMWQEHQLGSDSPRIQHVRNGGEKLIPAGPEAYHVDGFDGHTNTVCFTGADVVIKTARKWRFHQAATRWKPCVSRRKTNVRHSDRWGIKWFKSGNVNGRSRKRPQRKFKIFSRKSILHHGSIREIRSLEVELGLRRFITRSTQMKASKSDTSTSPI